MKLYLYQCSSEGEENDSIDVESLITGDDPLTLEQAAALVAVMTCVVCQAEQVRDKCLN